MLRIHPRALENDILLRGVWEGLGTPQCHVTGGYVRDRLLGGTSVDLDLVLPGDLDSARGPARRLAARLDTRAHILGQGANRVWRIEAPEIRIELWPLGGLNLDQDIGRRDFSLNALVWPLPAGPLDDRIGGLVDLEEGRIRALSRNNLEDDPVRLARAPRFVAQLKGFRIDPQTAGWISSLAPSLADAPRERIGQELSKLLAAPGIEPGLRSLIELGLLEPSAPSPAACDRQWLEHRFAAASRLAGAWPHPLRAAVAEAGVAARLALLFRAWGCPDADTVAAYAWPRDCRRLAVGAASLFEDAIATVANPIADRRAFIHDAGETFPATLALAAAVEPNRPWARWWRLWRERGGELVDPEPLLSSEEIGAITGVKPGPALGRAIDALTEAQVRGEVRTANGARVWLTRTFER